MAGADDAVFVGVDGDPPAMTIAISTGTHNLSAVPFIILALIRRRRSNRPSGSA